MITRRLLETAAMTIIGDSFLCLLSPRRHVSLWLDGPRWWRASTEPFVRYPTLTRALGVAGIAFGVLLAWRQEPTVMEIQSSSGASLRRLQEAMR